MAFIIYIPVLLVWGGTLFLVGLFGYRTFRYAERRLKGKQQFSAI